MVNEPIKSSTVEQFLFQTYLTFFISIQSISVREVISIMHCHFVRRTVPIYVTRQDIRIVTQSCVLFLSHYQSMRVFMLTRRGSRIMLIPSDSSRNRNVTMLAGIACRWPLIRSLIINSSTNILARYSIDFLSDRLMSGSR